MKNKTRSVFAYLVILVAAAIRSFQLLNTVDPVTGNVINAYIPLQKFFSIGILACLLAVTVISFFSKPRTECFTVPSKALAVTSALLACSLMFDGFKILFGLFKDVSSASVLPIVLFAFSVLAALYFVSLSVSMFSQKQIFPNPLLPAFVILCFALKLVSQYMHSVQNADISEQRFSILMYAAFTLFWVFFARFSNKSKKSKRFVSLFSFIAVFCGVTVILPRIIAFAVPHIFPAYYSAPSAVFGSNELFAADIAAVIFAIAFIYYINRGEKVKDDEEEEFILEGIKGVSTDTPADDMMQSVMGTKTADEVPAELTADSVQSLIDEVLPEITEEEINQITFEEEIIPQKEPFKVTIEEPEVEVEETTEQEPKAEAEPEEEAEPETVLEEAAPEIEVQPEVKAEPEIEIQPEVTPLSQSEKPALEEMEQSASADDIINNLLDEIMGKYGEDN